MPNFGASHRFSALKQQKPSQSRKATSYDPKLCADAQIGLIMVQGMTLSARVLLCLDAAPSLDDGSRWVEAPHGFF
jgi:hypothetical protein